MKTKEIKTVLNFDPFEITYVCGSFCCQLPFIPDINSWIKKKLKVKWSRYRPGVAQRVGRGIALLFHDCGIRMGLVANSTPRPHFTPWKDPTAILQVVGWASGPDWTGGKSRPHRNSIPDRPARSSVAIPTELPGPRILEVTDVYLLELFVFILIF